MTTPQVHIYILQMRKLEFKVIKRLAQVYTIHGALSTTQGYQGTSLGLQHQVWSQGLPKGIHSSTKWK